MASRRDDPPPPSSPPPSSSSPFSSSTRATQPGQGLPTRRFNPTTTIATITHDPHDNSTQAIRSTDMDALGSRYSAVQLGYLQDSSIHSFVPKTFKQQSLLWKRPPLINLGTHVRVWSIDQLVQQFIHQFENVQVLNLGAGTDTRFWTLNDQQRLNVSKWIEMDFIETTSSKCKTIVTNPHLKQPLGSFNIYNGGSTLVSERYALIPGDLKQWSQCSQTLIKSNPFNTTHDHVEPLLDPNKPTLLLLECVLFYLPIETRHDILSWFSSTFSNTTPRTTTMGGTAERQQTSIVVAYDPFRLQDSFGKVMLRNLKERGLNWSTKDMGSTSLKDQIEWYQQLGFKHCQAMSIKQIRDTILPLEELKRVNEIEKIDEIEELNLILDHYNISWALTNQQCHDQMGLQTV
ncbi:carboxy methyl transferase for protein phosphatase 2A [Microbotryomycetes sp. JL221]|nr:carboxy methyl transferase for protein phosphatase 2A [Microbotryomycetes sp. JL221]